MLLLYTATANTRRSEESMPKICPLTDKVVIPPECEGCKHKENCDLGDIIKENENYGS